MAAGAPSRWRSSSPSRPTRTSSYRRRRRRVAMEMISASLQRSPAPAVSPVPASFPLFLDVGPAARQQAGLATLSDYDPLFRDHSNTLDLTLVNAHSGHRLPAGLREEHAAGYRAHGAVSVAPAGARLADDRSPLPAAERRLRASRTGRTSSITPPSTCSPPLVPRVLTVHDLIFERYPQHHTRRNVPFSAPRCPVSCARRMPSSP